MALQECLRTPVAQRRPLLLHRKPKWCRCCDASLTASIAAMRYVRLRKLRAEPIALAMSLAKIVLGGEQGRVTELVCARRRRFGSGRRVDAVATLREVGCMLG